MDVICEPLLAQKRLLPSARISAPQDRAFTRIGALLSRSRQRESIYDANPRMLDDLGLGPSSEPFLLPTPAGGRARAAPSHRGC